jgi:hypothetical protein
VKSGKRPNKRQKLAMQSVGLNHDHWLVFKVIDDKLHLVHRETGTTKVIPA